MRNVTLRTRREVTVGASSGVPTVAADARSRFGRLLKTRRAMQRQFAGLSTLARMLKVRKVSREKTRIYVGPVRRF